MNRIQAKTRGHNHPASLIDRQRKPEIKLYFLKSITRCLYSFCQRTETYFPLWLISAFNIKEMKKSVGLIVEIKQGSVNCSGKKMPMLCLLSVQLRLVACLLTSVYRPTMLCLCLLPPAIWCLRHLFLPSRLRCLCQQTFYDLVFWALFRCRDCWIFILIYP